MKQFDFIIIGGGIAGAGMAYHLARTARVAILERESFAGYHTTGRSAALFAETYGNAPIRALNRGSRRFFENPPPGFAEHPLVTPRGCLFIARPDQLDALAAHRLISPAQARTLDGDGIRRLVPVLRADYAAAAILDTDVMDIDVHALHQGFLRGARAQGAEVLSEAEVLRLNRRGELWQVDTGIGTFGAAVIVNAAGAWADVVGALAGARAIGLRPLRRTAMLIDPPAGMAVDG
ncbi:MAG TPA: FAD-dependent oxidoreductase, partial [Stellaceae bacterium]